MNICKAAVHVHTHIRNIYTFTIEQGGNIHHQTLPIIRFHFYGNRESVLHFPPVHLQESFLVFCSQYVWAILPVDGRSASTRNIAYDLITGRWVTTARHLPKQTF